MTYQIENLKKLSKQEPKEGMRVCRVIAKKGMIGNFKTESQGVEIPTLSAGHISVILNADAGKEFFLNAVATVQDGIVRKIFEGGSRNAIMESQIDTDAIIAAMKTANESQRFSKESIRAWFATNLAQALEDAIRTKYPAIAASKLPQMVAAYLEGFQILAGRQPSMSKEVKASLIRALEFLPTDAADDATTLEVAQRLAEVNEAVALLGAL